MHPILRLLRPGNALVSLAGTVVGGLAARGSGLPTDPGYLLLLGLAAVSTALVTAGGNVLNDLGDVESDRRNHPDRPLVTGAVSRGTARGLAAALFVVGGLLIVPFSFAHPYLPVIFLVAVGSLLAYEGAFKSQGLPGNALVALLTAAVFLYGGATTDRLVVDVPFAVMAFGATLSRELIKDMEDAEGDVDRRTLPRTHGLATAGAAARVAVAAAIVLSPWPFVNLISLGTAAGIMYAALVLAADAVFVVSVWELPRRLHREQTLSKVAMSVALLAFLAVAFR